MLILLVIVMLIGSFLAGSIPLEVSLSEVFYLLSILHFVYNGDVYRIKTYLLLFRIINKSELNEVKFQLNY